MSKPIMHKPGECTDPLYGNPWCTGVGVWGPDPFAEEIYGDSTLRFMCDGERAGSAADI